MILTLLIFCIFTDRLRRIARGGVTDVVTYPPLSRDILNIFYQDKDAL